MVLTEQQREEFIENGVIVVPSLFQQEEIALAREGFHQTLKSYGIDVNNLENTGRALGTLSSTKGAGGVIDLFYMDWKLALNQDERIVSLIEDIWSFTYAVQHPFFTHPFETINPQRAYMAVDRVCFRLPEYLSQQLGKSSKHPLQRSLTPHLDCCPHQLFNNLTRWKPIQCFIALTDTTEANQGGFECCKGFHKEISSWSTQRTLPTYNNSKSASTTSTTYDCSSSTPSQLDQLCVGQYTAIRSLEEADIIQRFEHIPYKAGDIILWDYRIPHANSLRNESTLPREVVYIGLLPDIELNRNFAKDQLHRFSQGILPVGFWHKSEMRQHCNFEFSPLGRKLMTIDPWI